MNTAISIEQITSKILEVRAKKVMMDSDLAQLYGVETKYLTRQVRRNIKRFPEDFMFKLTRDEYRFLRCQNVTLKRGAHSKYLPYVFTEQGVAMLSSVLNSEKAIHVNVLIMRAFVKLREFIVTHRELAVKIKELERKYAKHDEKIIMIFEAIQQLLRPSIKEKPRIGFQP